MPKLVLLLLFVMYVLCGWSQTFPVAGQLSTTAFPVCGTNVFKQKSVPMGQTTGINVPGCRDGQYTDVNPFWYTFTCYKAGTLAFVITPNDLGDDYDWMLYDITGHKASEAPDNTTLAVIGNWSGTYGKTGARAGGSTITECASDPATQHTSTFSTTPLLQLGHIYLLLVSHYTQSQSGYSLSFGGGTAVITDTTVPHMKTAAISCDRKTLLVTLNKHMRCISLSPDGSDFNISGNPGVISSANGIGCTGFNMDSLQINLKAPLDPGTYTLGIKDGDDGNTLLDDCGTGIIEGESVSFTVLPPHPTPFDSLKQPLCAPQQVQLIFSDPIQCSSIAADGSDFIISGSPAVAISSVEGVCTGGLTSVINIRFTAPLVRDGNYQVSLVRGSDGNSIINECGVETPTGGQLSFFTRDTVSASFSYSTFLACSIDSISLFYQPDNGVSSWSWIVDSSFISQLEPHIPESVFGLKTVEHIVSNGFCSDTVTQVVNLDNTLKAIFQAPDVVCPKNVLAFSNSTIGKVVSWNWDFGDGTTSTDKTPSPHLFPDTWTGKQYTVRLMVENDIGCSDTLTETITKLQSCYITVPNAFTPDGNGINDFLYPLNAYNATDLEFRVFNRYGQMVFETRNWTYKWDGTVHGIPQPSGTYVWTLRYVDGLSGKPFSTRGTSVLIR
jgi:gliding motility-associated-like protein